MLDRARYQKVGSGTSNSIYVFPNNKIKFQEKPKIINWITSFSHLTPLRYQTSHICNYSQLTDTVNNIDVSCLETQVSRSTYIFVLVAIGHAHRGKTVSGCLSEQEKSMFSVRPINLWFKIQGTISPLQVTSCCVPLRNLFKKKNLFSCKWSTYYRMRLDFGTIRDFDTGRVMKVETRQESKTWCSDESKEAFNICKWLVNSSSSSCSCSRILLFLVYKPTKFFHVI